MSVDIMLFQIAGGQELGHDVICSYHTVDSLKRNVG